MRGLPRDERVPGSARVALFAFLGFGVLFVTSCGGAATQRADESPAGALLVLHGLPDEAQVAVDERPMGTVGRTGGAYELDAGARRLTIVAPGFLTYRRVVRVVAGEVYDVDVELWPCFRGVDPECVGGDSITRDWFTPE